MDRRRFLRSAGAGTLALVAGCTTGPDDAGSPTESPGTGGPTETAEPPGTTVGSPTPTDRTLRVATYPSFVDAPSTSPGGWVKDEFESRTDATLEWFAPEQQVNYFIQRKQQGLTVDTDMFLGLVGLNLAHIDARIGDTVLFEETDASSLANGDHIQERYRFDTSNRVVPFGASFISFVYDENAVEAPDTYEKLTQPAYEDALIVPNPQNSETGEMFLLMTINEYGADGYLEYWQRLQDNGVSILGSWGDAYNAYSNAEAPIVVSYSTDQVFAERFDSPMSRHQIAFPNGQGYAYIEGMAKFAGTEKPDLADRFMEFVLEPDVQQEIAKRNVALTVVDNASLPDDLASLVYEPETPVSFSYDVLRENIGTWLEDWSRQIASN